LGIFPPKTVYFLGFLTRVKSRLKKPTLGLSSDSLVILASEKDNDSVIVGLVELCMEQPNGRLTSPIPVSKSDALNPTLEPYLCNLSVNPSHRGKGLGKVLCKLGENIVKKVWEKDVIYLHVEQDNTAAVLYESIGYELIPNYMSPWDRKMNSMENINYYKKLL
jgi:ribosomal protein S18 acetylase RimI-like enzyme